MRVLILGGTTEASALACALAGDARFAPVLSLAGRTRAPVMPPIPCRVGGFGGAEGLAAYLREERIAAVVDATHPFAARIKANALAAAERIGVAHLGVLRPAWRWQAGDRWHEVASMSEAFVALGTGRKGVFLTVGQQELAWFGPPHRYLIRSVDPPNPASLPTGAVVLTARGPFAVEHELALLRSHDVQVVVTKNSGGSATAAKLAAARALGLPVVMVARPPPPGGAVVEDAPAALRWLVHQAGCWRGV